MLTAVAGLFITVELHASALGQASNYNIFIFGNDTQKGTDAEGRVAIGGNYDGIANGGDITIASQLSATSGYNFVVGGNLNYINNTVNGDIFVGGNAYFSGDTLTHDVRVNGSLSLNNMNYPPGTVTYGTSYSQAGTGTQTASKGTTTSPINFGTAQTDLQNLSASLDNLAATTTVSTTGNNLTINAVSGLNIVKLTAAQLANHTGLTINGPSDATVVIDVAGASDSFSGSGYNLTGGITANKVLYNFRNASTLSSTNAGILGSILAPYAAFNFIGGNINGQIIAYSVGGQGEAHNYLFDGTLPAVSVATPEPSTWISFAAGVLLLAGFARIRPRKS